MPYKIFICYRRVDKELARLIQGKLSKAFGTESIFLDFEGIKGGQKWKNSIAQAFEGDPIVVTIITSKWNSHRGGKPKLMDPEDHVRYELETALDRGLMVVPVIYERANIPKKHQIPISLHPLLQFQNIRFSLQRLDYDSGKLIEGLEELLKEKEAVAEPQIKGKKEPKKKHEAKHEDKVLIQPPPNTFAPTIAPTIAPTYTRSMFTLTPQQKKEMAERAKKEEERLSRIRAESSSFYVLPSFWIAATVTILLTAGSIWGAEILAQTIAKDIKLPKSPLEAGILIASSWSLVWIILAIAHYRYDPELSPKVFYTQGIFGGWLLGYEEFEPIGFWAAFPVCTAVLWLVARGLAMLALHYFGWNYLLIFWIVIGVYTLPVLALYALEASDTLI